MGLHLDDALSPSKPPPGLTRTEPQIAYLMVHGLPVPRSLEQAAADCGYRVREARCYLADLPGAIEPRDRGPFSAGDAAR
jgi:hypothetical protein